MRQSLQDWEKYFEPYFQRVHLLGEIPLSSLECEEIGQFIQRLVLSKGQSEATNLLKRRFPRSFCMFLVGMGLYGYNEGDYWSAVRERTGINSPHQLGWGEIFLAALGEYRLPDFHEIQGHRFLAPILAHGGIPEKSLGDYFQYVIQPWLNKPELQGLNGKEYVPKALEHLASYPMVDKPIARFLEYGIDAACDFLERCRLMALATQQTGELPTPVEAGLPPYVLRGYRKFLDEIPASGTGKRLRPPLLMLDPYTPGFTLELPSQPLEALKLGAGDYLWQVSLRLCDAEGKAKPLTWVDRRVPVHHQGYDVLTEGDSLPLDEPAHEIEVRFTRRTETGSAPEDLEVLRAWRLHLQPTADQPPLVIFRYPDGAAVRWNQSLAAGKYWLLLPRSVTVDAEGGEFFEQGSPFFGAWDDWALQAWDLEKVDVLHLMEGGQECCLPIPLRRALEEPELTGGECLLINRDPDGVPVYIGLPPEVRLPLRPGRPVVQELANWNLQIHSRWAARPAIEQTLRLPEKDDLPSASDAHIDIPLQRWLGNRPCGTYRLTVSGPGGMGGDFRFRVWPELLIDGLKRLHLPEAQGAMPVVFDVSVTEGCEVTPQPGVGTTQVEKIGGFYRVIVAPQATLAELQLVDHQVTPEAVRLPLSLAVPRLRWALALDGGGAQPEWHTSPVRVAVDALLQSRQPGLHLELGLQGNEPLTIQLRLMDGATGEQLMLGSRALTWRPGQERGYLPLGEFSDTLCHYAEVSNFELRLDIWDPEDKTSAQATLARMGREMEISYALLMALNPPEFELVWEERRPLCNRRARITSLWQPWADPIDLAIPDEAHGSLTFTAALPPSHYLAHFYTAAAWEQIDVRAPLPGKPYPIETATPEQRLRWIRHRLEEDERQAFALHFEMACIHETQKATADVASEITWCYQNLDQASPELMIAFYHWLGRRDTATQKAVGTKLFRPGILRKVLESYRPAHPLRRAYMSVFPRVQRTWITPESALLALEKETDPTVTSHAFQALFERQHPEAVAQLLKWVNGGLMGEADAEDLLALKPEWSFRQLEDAAQSPPRERLLLRLIQRYPGMEGLVTVKSWVRCDAGYGVIERLQDAETGLDLPYVRLARADAILTIKLRPKHQSEVVVINLAQESLDFPGYSRVYACARENCWHFISAELQKVLKEHNHAAHQGIGPAQSPLQTPLSLRYPIDVLQEAPPDEFA